jgi:hypothetical protein
VTSAQFNAARELLPSVVRIEKAMSVVRILGFSTLPCGCVVGRYRDVASTREMVYVEEKGVTCENQAHRRNHTVSAERERYVTLTAMTARAS